MANPTKKMTKMRDEDLNAMQAALEAVDDVYEDTVRLRTADYELFGRIIQLFCVTDVESRRVIGAMRTILGLPALEVGKLTDKDVPIHLKGVADKWTGSNEVRTVVLSASEFFSAHEHIRHSIAHWAARRIRGHDAFYFISTRLNHKTPNSWHQVPNEEPGGDAGFRLLLASQLERLLTQGEPLAHFLGTLAPTLEVAIAAKAERLQGGR